MWWIGRMKGWTNRPTNRLTMLRPHQIKILVKYLPTQLLEEKYHYFADESIDVLTAKIHDILEHPKPRYFGTNLEGKFVSARKLHLMPGRRPGSRNNPELRNAYLDAELIDDAPYGTRLVVYVRSSFGYALSFILGPAIGLPELVYQFIYHRLSSFPSFAMLSTFVAPLMAVYGSYRSKKKLRKTFASAFNLKPFQFTAGI